MNALPHTASSGVDVVPARPRVADVAIVFTFLAAAVNALIGVLLPVQAAASGLSVPAGPLVAVVAISVLYAAALVVLALFVRRGRVWARGALASVSALSLLAIFALNALNALVVVLLVVADLLLYRRSVSRWVRALRGLSAG